MSGEGKQNFVNAKRSTEYDVDFQDSLLTCYREKTQLLEEQLGEATLRTTGKEIEKEIELLRKALEDPLGRLNFEGSIDKRDYREYRDRADISVASIKRQLSTEIKEERVESYLEQEEARKSLSHSIREGLGFINILQNLREKLNIFAVKTEEIQETVEALQQEDRTLPYQSAGDIF